MDRKMECPICKKKAVFVGVHDDEGNYHGLMGCEYENAPWSGLSYALHHEGWGDCPLCTDGAESTMGGMLFDTAEEAISALSPPNETPPCYQPDGDGCAYQCYDGDDEPIDKCKECPLCYSDKQRHHTPPNEPLTCEGCYYDKIKAYVHCSSCSRDKKDLYRRPPEGEEERHGD